ncbi:ESPR-type extended signal peptide-containing protein [Escherichia coli]|uniref:ESPR-type extended signal peptide-containing protein n=1 Tax=Escherichia coli TaxID=562 RepID=UPI000DDC9EA7|nr:autotransporter domain-containing protein [Escherichia coli]
MKRHLNTSYRLVWNHITGTLVVASELARSRGKRAGVAVALSLAAVTSLPVLAADTVVQAGETVSGVALENHDNQIVFGTTNGMTISTGLEYGPDNEANTGGQWIQNGGIANNTTVTGGGLQRVNAGGSVSDTVISAGGGQSLQGQAVNTTLNGGEQWVHEGGIATGTVINEKGWQAVKSGAVATDTVVNTGAEGGPDAENGDTGQFVRGNAVRTTINKNGRQIVAQGTRHSMKASSDNNDFRARGWGWLGSLETGLPFSITDNLMLEPQLQYTWQGLSLDDGQDNAGYVKFGHGSAQHVRAGFRLGSHNDMTFGEGTSSRDTLRDSAKHSVRELPVNWWVQPSVIRTFSSRGDMSMGTAAAGSNMTFSPSQNGTSLDLQAGLEARVRENITLGVQAGYAHSVSGSSAEGYNGQATLNVTF